jgi:hypothetical protein
MHSPPRRDRTDGGADAAAASKRPRHGAEAKGHAARVGSIPPCERILMDLPFVITLQVSMMLCESSSHQRPGYGTRSTRNGRRLECYSKSSKSSTVLALGMARFMD